MLLEWSPIAACERPGRGDASSPREKWPVATSGSALRRPAYGQASITLIVSPGLPPAAPGLTQEHHFKEVAIMQVVRIVGDVVELLEQSEVKRTKLQDFLAHLSEQSGIRTPILAPGTIFYASKGRLSVLALEVPPSRRAIKYRPREGRIQEFALPFPWIYVLAAFSERALDRVYVFLAPKPVRSTEAQLFHVPLPNRYSDGLVCMGTFRFDLTLSNPDKVQELVGFFFESLFTHEVLDSFNSYVPDEIATRTKEGTQWLEGWSKLSDDELQSVRWKPYKSFDATVQTILGSR
jgi:hypothetical protein